MRNLEKLKLEELKNDIANYAGATKYPILFDDISKMDKESLLKLSNKIDDFYNITLLNNSYKKYDLLKS
jgi:hypothetical protein